MEKKTNKKKPNLLFKKYFILNKIDEGSFGSIYLAKNKDTDEKVAIKVENRKQYKPLLENEAYILYYLRGRGIPQIITFGKTREYFILVQTLLGPSLSTLIDHYNIDLTIKDICMLSIQMIERLEYIHSKDYIHRDIKPHNFLMGLKDENMVYIIDFGLSKKYRSKKGNHIKFSITNNITGTPRYCSINALRGAEQSRRDDIESLFYVIIYFFKGSLPWQNLKIKSRTERFNKINQMKKKIDYKDLCKNLPEEIYNLGIYIKNLKFEEEPNYNYMQKLFYSILTKIREENDDKFSWIKFNFNNSQNYSQSHKNIFKQKTSFHKRLYEKISNSLEKKLFYKKNNKIISLNNSIKDNITLISLNIDFNDKVNNDIKKSCSYTGITDLRVTKLINRNTSQNLLNNINNNFLNNKNNKSNKNNRMVIKKIPTTIKISKINNCLNSDNIGNANDNELNQLNSSNNESIKNLLLKHNKISYTSPCILTEIKKFENLENNTKLNTHKKVNKGFFQKIINKNKINKYTLFLNNSSDINYYQKEQIIFPTNKIFDKISFKSIYNNKINNISIPNNTKRIENNKNIKNYYNKSIKKKYNNYYHTSNNNAIININLEKSKVINRTNSVGIPISNIIFNKANLNLANKSNKKRIKIMKNKSTENKNINLNIKLINNNNYNNAPFMIYNGQFNKLNNISNKKNYKIKNKMENVNAKNYNTKSINSNRIIKYIVQRKTLNNIRKINDYRQSSGFEEGNNNNLKLLNSTNNKLKLDNNNNNYYSLYH